MSISLKKELPEKTFGQRLRKKRIEKGLSIKQLAEMSGVSPESISFWERGLKKPRAKTLKKVVSSLGVDLDYLLQFEIKDKTNNIIYKCRISNGLTQKELAKLLNVNRSTIQDWESGKYIPSKQKIKRLLLNL